MCLLQCLHCTDEAHIGRNRGTLSAENWFLDVLASFSGLPQQNENEKQTVKKNI